MIPLNLRKENHYLQKIIEINTCYFIRMIIIIKHGRNIGVRSSNPYNKVQSKDLDFGIYRYLNHLCLKGKGNMNRKLTKEEILRILRENMDKIRSFGVKRIAIFGSAVRDELKKDSDIDFVVEFEEDRGNMKDFIGLIDFLENLLGRSVDVLTPYGVENIRIKHIKETIKKEMEYV
jgi:predicted nucleotidyltransferase